MSDAKSDGAARFEVGGYLRLRDHELRRGRGRVCRVVSLTPSGLPRIQPRDGAPAHVAYGCRPATEAEWLEQERQDVTKRRIWTLDRRLRAALDEPRVLDLRVALINAAAADWLRESGWTVTAPGVPD